MITLEDLDRRMELLELAQASYAKRTDWAVANSEKVMGVLIEHTTRLTAIEAKLDGLIESLPRIVGDAVREALNERKP
jgi:hypothetical protein